MSISKPRITITLEPSTAQLLKRLSELTRSSQSSLVADLLDQSVPVLSRMVQVLEAAEQAKNSLRRSSIERLEEAQQRVEGLLGLVMADFDQTVAPIEQEAQKVRRRAAKASTAAKKQPEAASVSSAKDQPAATARKGKKQASSGAAATRSQRGADASDEVASTPLSNRGVRLTRRASKVIATDAGSAKLARKRVLKK